MDNLFSSSNGISDIFICERMNDKTDGSSPPSFIRFAMIEIKKTQSRSASQKKIAGIFEKSL